MSQVDRKWIKDQAINGAKVDPTSDFTMSSLQLIHDCTMSGNFGTAGNLRVDNTAIVGKFVNIYGVPNRLSLGVGGDATVGGYFRVGRDATIAGGLSVGGTETIIGDTTVTGTLRAGRDATVGGYFRVGRDATIAGGLSVGGTETIIGDTTVTGTLRAGRAIVDTVIGVGTITPLAGAHVKSDGDGLMLEGISDGTSNKPSGAIELRGYAATNAFDFGMVNTVNAYGDYRWDLFNTTGAVKLCVLGTGNVGIGMTIPAYLLHMKKDQNNGTYLVTENATSGSAAASIIIAQSDATNYVALSQYSTLMNMNTGGISDKGMGLISSSNINGLFVNNRSNTPLYLATNDTIQVTVTKGGDVGIGTTAPIRPFGCNSMFEQASGSATGYQLMALSSYRPGQGPILMLRQSQSSTTGVLTTTTSGAYTGTIQFKGVSSAGSPAFAEGAQIEVRQYNAAGTSNVPCDMVIATNSSTAYNSQQLVLNQSGSVGIGTGYMATPPAANLHIYDPSSTATDKSLMVQSAVSPSGIKLVVQADGKVGIGTSVPPDKVSAWDPTNAGFSAKITGDNNPYLILDGNRTAAESATGSVIFKWNGNYIATIDSRAGFDTLSKNMGGLAFTTYNGGVGSEIMRVTYDGKVGIGTTVTGSSLQVNGTAAIGYASSVAAPINSLVLGGQLGVGITNPAQLIQAVQDQNAPTLIEVDNNDLADSGALSGFIANNGYYPYGFAFIQLGKNNAGGLGGITAPGMAVVQYDSTNGLMITNSTAIGSGGPIYLSANGYTSHLTVQINGSVGIGTTIQIDSGPSVTVASNTSSSIGRFSTYSTLPGNYSKLIFEKSDSAGFALSATQVNDNIGTIAAYGVNSSGTVRELCFDMKVIQTGASGLFHVPSMAVLETSSSSAMNTNQLVLASNGGVGIGTTVTGSSLQVNGNAAIGYPSSVAAPANGLLVQGQVGIGITTPAYFVHAVLSTSSNANIEIDNTNSGPSASAGFGASNGASSIYLYQNGINTSTFGMGGLNSNGMGVLQYGSSTGLLVTNFGSGGPIYFSATGSSTNMAIAANGDVGIGTTSPVRPSAFCTSMVEHASGGTVGYQITALSSYRNNATGPYLQLRYSRNPIVGALTTTNNNDFIGAIQFQGVNSAGSPAFTTGASVTVQQSGAANSSAVPTKMLLQTSSISGPNTNHLILDSSGNVGVGTATINARFHTVGNYGGGGGIIADGTSGTSAISGIMTFRGYATPGSAYDMAIYNAVASAGVYSLKFANNTGATIAKIDQTGQFYSNAGVTIITPADFAEWVRVQGNSEDYDIGTVVMQSSDDLLVCKASDTEVIYGVVTDRATFCGGLVESLSDKDIKKDFMDLPKEELEVKYNAKRVAMVGHVQCKVMGTIRKNQLLTLSNIPGVARAALIFEEKALGFAIARQDYDSEEVGLIEVRLK